MAQTLMDMKARYPNDPLRQRMVDKFLGGSMSIVLPLLYFVEAKGFAYEYITRDNFGGVSFRSINTSYTTANSKSSVQREPMALFGGDVRTDYAIIDVKGDAARMDEIDARMVAAGKYFDKQFFNGDPSVANQSNQMRGIKARAAGTQLSWMAANGGPLTLDAIDTAIDTVAGDNKFKHIFCNRFVRRKISNLMKLTTGTKGVEEAAFQVANYNGCPIHTVDEDEAYNPILDFTEARGNSNLTTSLYVARFGTSTDDEFVQGIAGNQFMQLRPPSPQGTYVLEVAETLLGLGTFHPRSIARIGGITQA